MKKLLIACLIINSSCIFSCKSMEFLNSTAKIVIPESIKITAPPLLAGLALHTTTKLLHDYCFGNSCCKDKLRCFLKKSLFYSIPSLILAGASQLPIGSWPQLTSSDLSFPMKIMFAASTTAATLTSLFYYWSFNDKNFKRIETRHKGLTLTKQQTNFLQSTLIFLEIHSQIFIPVGCLALSAYALGKRSSMSS